jgi:hypothetical protein
MILVMEGFDIQCDANVGLDTGGEQDQGGVIGSQGTTGDFRTEPGYLAGNAAKMFYDETLGWGSVSRMADFVDGTQTTLVFDAWVSGFLKNNGDQSGYSNMVKVGRSGKYYFLGYSATGNNIVYRLFTDTVAASGGTVVAISDPGSSISFNLAWHHIRLTVDILTGAVSLYVNGTLHLSGTGWVQAAWGGVPGWSFNSPVTGANRTWDVLMDHLVWYDAIPTSTTLGYSIQASADRWESSSDFQGVLVNAAGTDSFKTDTQGSLIASPNVGDDNRANTMIYMYGENPETAAAWEDGEIDTYAWGVCNVHGGANPVGRNRLAGLLFNTWVYNGGTPTIEYTTPGVLTYFDGNWSKTDESVSWAGHLQSVPRDNNGLTDTWAQRDDTDFLAVYGNGCILFGAPTVPLPEGFPIGITFAEERRADHSDWNDILGDGIDYESYFITGYGIFGQGDKKFQGNYVTVNYENLGTDSQIGSATIQGVWDYALNGNTGRWSSKQQIYGPRSDLDYKHSRSRVKIRGHGTSLQMRVASVGSDPFTINGWTVAVSGNTNV